MGVFYVCRECGYESLKWLGRCPSCDGWNTLSEITQETAKKKERRRSESVLLTLGEDLPESFNRVQTGEADLDRILGGGVVPGSLILLGGEPGIGKSTLLLQTAAGLAENYGKVIYVSAEESASQVGIRAERLGLLSASLNGELLLSQENEVEYLLAEAREVKPKVLIVDSIQTMRSTVASGLPGSPSQVREVVQALMEYTKESEIICFLVGHITKSGLLAGPKLVEHMVDAVLYFEGDKRYSYRILRVTKNRFGSTQEIALYDLTDRGLLPVLNPSAAFLAERYTAQSGTIVTPILEGNLPLLIEIQTLIAKGSYGTPRRLVSGLDSQRVAMVLAVLERRVGLPVSTDDVYVSVIGGIRTEEPATDTAVALALASNYYEEPLPWNLVALGEIGLTGEIRRVGGGQRRLLEARRHGFSRVVLPRSMIEEIQLDGLEVIGVSTVQELLAEIFKRGG
ncbi:MAG TPA: DNA repair protein RadA [Firmicutes bacterium]|nr:DNA repair protein RadA [Bacillota bacterium]